VLVVCSMKVFSNLVDFHRIFCRQSPQISVGTAESIICISEYLIPSR